jgi:hypothetical protein
MLFLMAQTWAATVAEAFPPPEAAERVEASDWALYLQGLELAEAERPVRTYDGRRVHHHARVVELPLVPGDLQQCADALIRLRAEYLLQAGEAVSFQSTSGDAMPWARYRDGETPYLIGDEVRWRPGGTGQWEDYLVKVFRWAGTVSLQERETELVEGPPLPGDLLVQGGFPGHAVVLLDVAVEGDRTWVLVGESFMPAQDFHVELGPEGGWWLWEGGVDLPSWAPFTAGDLRRWR